MKILFILPEYYPHSGGGISTFYINLLAHLVKSCDEIKVIVGSGYTQSDDQFTHNGILVEYLKPSLFSSFQKKFSKYDLVPDFRNNLAAAWAMWQQAEQAADYDIVECTDFGLGFVPWALHHSKPVVTRLHGSSGQIALHEHIDDLAAGLYSAAELNLLTRCDSLATYSIANQHFWEKVFPLKKVHQSYPVYTTFTTPLPFCDRDTAGLVTGRIQKWKGPVELCQAVSYLSAPVQIKWFGRDMPFNEDPSTSAYLKKTFKAVWEQQILPQAPVSYDKVQLLQRKALFGVAPSTWDMFNFTGLEFLAVGTPLICSDGAGMSELIQHGHNGFKFPSGDAEALAKCLQDVYNLNEQAYDQIVQKGINTINKQLSPQRLIPDYIKHYQEVIEAFSPIPDNMLAIAAYSPENKFHTVDAVWDKQPLKKLGKYLIKRLLRKIKG